MSTSRSLRPTSQPTTLLADAKKASERQDSKALLEISEEMCQYVRFWSETPEEQRNPQAYQAMDMALVKIGKLRKKFVPKRDDLFEAVLIAAREWDHDHADTPIAPSHMSRAINHFDSRLRSTVEPSHSEHTSRSVEVKGRNDDERAKVTPSQQKQRVEQKARVDRDAHAKEATKAEETKREVQRNHNEAARKKAAEAEVAAKKAAEAEVAAKQAAEKKRARVLQEEKTRSESPSLPAPSAVSLGKCKAVQQPHWTTEPLEDAMDVDEESADEKEKKTRHGKNKRVKSKPTIQDEDENEEDQLEESPARYSALPQERSSTKPAAPREKGSHPPAAPPTRNTTKTADPQGSKVKPPVAPNAGSSKHTADPSKVKPSPPVKPKGPKDTATKPKRKRELSPPAVNSTTVNSAIPCAQCLISGETCRLTPAEGDKQKTCDWCHKRKVACTFSTHPFPPFFNQDLSRQPAVRHALPFLKSLYTGTTETFDIEVDLKREVNKILQEVKLVKDHAQTLGDFADTRYNELREELSEAFRMQEVNTKTKFENLQEKISSLEKALLENLARGAQTDGQEDRTDRGDSADEDDNESLDDANIAEVTNDNIGEIDENDIDAEAEAVGENKDAGPPQVEEAGEIPVEQEVDVEMGDADTAGEAAKPLDAPSKEQPVVRNTTDAPVEGNVVEQEEIETLASPVDQEDPAEPVNVPSSPPASQPQLPSRPSRAPLPVMATPKSPVSPIRSTHPPTSPPSELQPGLTTGLPARLLLRPSSEPRAPAETPSSVIPPEITLTDATDSDESNWVRRSTRNKRTAEQLEVPAEVTKPAKKLRAVTPSRSTSNTASTDAEDPASEELSAAPGDEGAAEKRSRTGGKGRRGRGGKQSS